MGNIEQLIRTLWRRQMTHGKSRRSMCFCGSQNVPYAVIWWIDLLGIYNRCDFTLNRSLHHGNCGYTKDIWTGGGCVGALKQTKIWAMCSKRGMRTHPLHPPPPPPLLPTGLNYPHHKPPFSPRRSHWKAEEMWGNFDWFLIFHAGQKMPKINAFDIFLITSAILIQSILYYTRKQYLRKRFFFVASRILNLTDLCWKMKVSLVAYQKPIGTNSNPTKLSK